MDNNSTKRVFVAIELTREVKSSLRGLMEQYQKSEISGRYENPDNLHITLAFIGETDRVEDIKAAISQIKFEPFRIDTTQVGWFETRHNTKVMWMGLSNESRPEALAQAVRNSLDAIGVQYSNTPFKPHITLAKGNVSAKLQWPSIGMIVSKISLMETTYPNGCRKYITL